MDLGEYSVFIGMNDFSSSLSDVVGFDGFLRNLMCYCRIWILIML